MSPPNLPPSPPGAAIRPPQNPRAAQRGNLQRLARAHRIGPPRHPLQQQRLPRLADQVARIIAGRAVHAKAHRHPGIAHRGGNLGEHAGPVGDGKADIGAAQAVAGLGGRLDEVIEDAVDDFLVERRLVAE